MLQILAKLNYTVLFCEVVPWRSFSFKKTDLIALFIATLKCNKFDDRDDDLDFGRSYHDCLDDAGDQDAHDDNACREMEGVRFEVLPHAPNSFQIGHREFFRGPVVLVVSPAMYHWGQS